MYIIEVFRNGEWTFGSSHTQSTDREVQFQRFIDNGITEENLRYKETE